MLAATTLAALLGLAACGQKADPGVAAGSTGATPGNTAVGVPPAQTGSSDTGRAVDGGSPPPSTAAGASAGDARSAAAELNPPDPGRPSANPAKGVTQPSPGFGNDHSSPQFGSATAR